MKYKEFDWEECERRNPDTAKFYRGLFDKPLSKQQFVAMWLRRWPGRTSTKQPAKKYDYFKATFGWFRGTENEGS